MSSSVAVQYPPLPGGAPTSSASLLKQKLNAKRDGELPAVSRLGRLNRDVGKELLREVAHAGRSSGKSKIGPPSGGLNAFVPVSRESSGYGPVNNNNNNNNNNSSSNGTQPEEKNVSSKLPVVSVKSSLAKRVSLKSDTSHRLGGSTCRLEVGLENLGNTCFMNSTLQCLMHVEPLVSYFLQRSIDAEVNKSSPTKGILAESFAGLVKEMRIAASGSGSSISPVNFQRAVSRLAPHLLDYQQQDCQEFLRFLLDGMSEDLCRTHDPTVSRQRGRRSESRTLSKTSSKNRMVRSNSVMSSAIGSRIASTAVSVEQTPRQIDSNKYNNQLTKSIDGKEEKLLSKTQPLPTEGLARSSISILMSKSQPLPTEQSSMPNKLRNVTQMFKDPNSEDESAQCAERDDSVAGEESPQCSPDKQPFKIGQTNMTFQLDDQQLREMALGSIGENSTATQSLNISGNQSIDFEESGLSELTPMQSIPSMLREHEPSPPSESISHAGRASFHNRRLHKSDRNNLKTKSAEKEHTGFIETSNASSTLAQPGSTDQQDDDKSKFELTPEPSFSVDVDERDVGNAAASKSEAEAKEAWSRYLKFNDSIVTDVFAGQLQSTIECLTCHNKSRSFEPFLDLSVPIAKAESRMLPTWRGRDVGGGRDSSSKCSLLECLNKFVGEELLDGENMVTCDHCKTKRKCNKTMTIFRYPRILVIHMKRFRYTNISREKLSTDVAFPIADLDLSPYISQDKLAANAARVLAGNKVGTQAPMHKPVYDLLGVSHHSGSMHGGHYIAHVNTGSGPGSIIGGINSHASSSKGSAKGTASQLDCNRWMCFNDARVSQVNTASIMGPSAYVLFYKLKDDHEHNWAYKR